MDGAFFRQDVLRWLQGRGVGYAIQDRWLDLQRHPGHPTWVPVAPGVTGFPCHRITPWHIPVVTSGQGPPPYQLDLHGHYEYSAVTSNLALTVATCGTRRAGEKTIAQLKTGLAFHSVPTSDLRRQQCVAAGNLLTNFQLGAPRRGRRHPEAHRRAPAAERADARFDCFIGPPCSAPVARGCG